MKQLKDLREFLEVLKNIGELQEVSIEVDWDLEVGAIIRRAYDLRAPKNTAVTSLFEGC